MSRVDQHAAVEQPDLGFPTRVFRLGLLATAKVMRPAGSGTYGLEQAVHPVGRRRRMPLRRHRLQRNGGDNFGVA